jgi:uroporphyrinogen-III synthase
VATPSDLPDEARPPALAAVEPLTIARDRVLLITRPAEQATVWMRALKAWGQPAQALPLLEIAPAPDPSAVVAAWHQLSGCASLGTDLQVVMFVSANAVAGFFACRPAGTAWPRKSWAASTGPGTTAALEAAGVPAGCIVEPPPDSPQFDSEALWQQLQPRCAPWAGQRVLVVRGGKGRDWLSDTLRNAGAQVQWLQAYESRCPQPSPAQQAVLTAALAQPRHHVWLFSSSQAVRHLQAWAPRVSWAASQAWVSHPRIAQAAHAAGFGTVIVLRPGLAAVAQQLGLANRPGRAGGDLYNLMTCE